jgi:hypothetical protein
MTDTFVIKRSKWLRGERYSVLLRHDDKKMCCLGQIADQCGVPTIHILDTTTPRKISPIFHDRIDFLIKKSDNFNPLNSELASSAMDINDDLNITDDEREEQLILLFAANGKTLVFED